MAKKKKKKKSRAQKRESRIARAKNWVPTYNGTKIVSAYRKKFQVDHICAIRELQEVGYEFEPGYVENLLQAETSRREQVRKNKEKKQMEEEYCDWQDDRFYFIAGYTSGGAAYGLTWEEMGLEPYENEFDDEITGTYCHYEFLSHREKNKLDDRLRNDFSNFVQKYRRLPSKFKRKTLIEQAFNDCENGAVLYDKGFNITYGKLTRKRRNKFIQEGILPKQFAPNEIKRFYDQSIMLENERLVFRKITPDDFDDIAEMLRNPQVMTAWEHTFSDEQIHKWIDNQIARYQKEIVGYFAVISKDTGKFIGQMGLMWNDFGELRALEIGYMLKSEYWGMGYAVEGATALAEYAFTVIGLNKVYASIRPENTHSIRVAEQIGMRTDGSFIKQYNGKEMEHLIYVKDRGERG